jgi:DNA invertase Pin-like site-specific DNA recombinase
MAVARAKGKLKGRKPKLSDRRQTELRRMYDTEEYSISGFAEVFDVSRPTVSRVLARTKAAGAGAVGQAG